jgi:hypothetical protein
LQENSTEEIAFAFTFFLKFTASERQEVLYPKFVSGHPMLEHHNRKKNIPALLSQEEHDSYMSIPFFFLL